MVIFKEKSSNNDLPLQCECKLKWIKNGKPYKCKIDKSPFSKKKLMVAL
jgi:hypothetical protein